MSTTPLPPLSLDELLDDAGLQRRLYRLSMAGHLLPRRDKLELELAQILDDDEKQKSRRVGSSSQAQAKAAELEAVEADIERRWLALILEAKEPKEWWAFKKANPAREGVRADERAEINLQAIVDQLPAEFLAEPKMTAEQWAKVCGKSSVGDLHSLAVTVFNMHEMGLDIPKSRVLSELRRRNAESSAQRRDSE